MAFVDLPRDRPRLCIHYREAQEELQLIAPAENQDGKTALDLRVHHI